MNIRKRSINAGISLPAAENSASINLLQSKESQKRRSRLVLFGTETLIESYRLIYRFIHHGGKIWMNSAIQKRVRWLYRNYGITRWEIIACIKQEFEKATKASEIRSEEIMFGNLRPEFHLFYIAHLSTAIQKTRDWRRERNTVFPDGRY